jgi:uncharacterized protein
VGGGRHVVRGDLADLLGVGEDLLELRGEGAHLVVGQRQLGEHRDVPHVVVGEGHAGGRYPLRPCEAVAVPDLVLAVLADTHRTAARARDLPAEVFALVEGADVVVHAGDITDRAVLDVLAEAGAPVHAVLGNNDRSLVGLLPERLDLELAGVRVGVVHDSGPAAGRARRLHRLFPDADLVVFGHSHIPWDEEGVGGQRLLNPGSPTQRRRQPVATLARVELGGGRVLRTEVLPVAPPPVRAGGRTRPAT